MKGLPDRAAQELEDRLAQARRRARDLEAALVRRELGLTCPTAEHETVMVQVCASRSARIEDIMRRLGANLRIVGYQLDQCLACGSWLARDFHGNLLGPVNEAEARILYYGER